MPRPNAYAYLTSYRDFDYRDGNSGRIVASDPNSSARADDDPIKRTIVDTQPHRLPVLQRVLRQLRIRPEFSIENGFYHLAIVNEDSPVRAGCSIKLDELPSAHFGSGESEELLLPLASRFHTVRHFNTEIACLCLTRRSCGSLICEFDSLRRAIAEQHSRQLAEQTHRDGLSTKWAVDALT